jgi:hypothetical protein
VPQAGVPRRQGPVHHLTQALLALLRFACQTRTHRQKVADRYLRLASVGVVLVLQRGNSSSGVALRLPMFAAKWPGHGLPVQVSTKAHWPKLRHVSEFLWAYSRPLT